MFKMNFSEKKIMNIRDSSGQIGVIIILLTVVLLTIVLSIASRSVTDVRFSRQEEETSRAFDAAEAGIEDALRKNLGDVVVAGGTGSVEVGTGCPGGPDCITADYNVSELNTLDTFLNEGETLEVNLDDPSIGAGDRVRIDWATEACPNAASIVVSVFNPTGGVVRRTPYGGCSTGVDNFALANSPGVSGHTFYQIITLQDGDAYMRIRAVYTGTDILVRGDGITLPVQFWLIHSEAQAFGRETRAVEVTQTVPAPPSIFDFVIFSGSSLVK